MTKPTVGIVGTGKLGLALGTRIGAADYPLLMAGRPGNPDTAAKVHTQIPGAQVVDFKTLAHKSEIVILALHQAAVRTLDLRHVGGVVVDATNPWDEGQQRADAATFTRDLARDYPFITFVKAFNHTAYFDFYTDAKPVGAPHRRALAVAGPDSVALRKVADLIDAMGFDPVPVYSRGARAIAMDGDLFGRKLDRTQLAREFARRGATSPARKSSVLDASF